MMEQLSGWRKDLTLRSTRHRRSKSYRHINESLLFSIHALEQRQLMSGSYSLTNLSASLPKNSTVFKITNVGQMLVITPTGYAVADLKGGFAPFVALPCVPLYPGQPPEPGQAWPAAINDSGQVVGYSDIISAWSSDDLPTDDAEIATLFAGDNPQSLGDLGYLDQNDQPDSGATGINNAGEIVGWARTPDGQVHAFSDSGGMTDLGTLDNATSQALAINNAGQIVGSLYSDTGVTTAFLYSDGLMTQLDPLPGDVVNHVIGINDKGQIVGYSQDSAGNDHAYLYSNGKTVALGSLPGDSSSTVIGISAGGDIVGTSLPSGTPFIYSGDKIQSLGDLVVAGSGVTIFGVEGINAKGQILGDGTDTSGDSNQYLLTPSTSIVVNTLDDPTTATDGTTSLREAISDAETAGVTQTITFAAGLSGTINLVSQLPDLDSNITIQGSTKDSVTVNGSGYGSVFTIDKDATAEIKNLTIKGGNTSQNGGGVENFGTLTIADCTITANASQQNGGGIDNQGTLTVANCTITANSATLGGGISDHGSMSITDCTIVQNTAGANGNGGVFSYGAPQDWTMDGTIVAENTGGDIPGAAVTGANDLIGDGSGPIDSLAASIFGSSNTAVDPFVGPLADNGGPTKTMMPLTGSRAIGQGADFSVKDLAGENLTSTDQLGNQRISGMTNIGSFQGNAPSVLALANLSNDVYSATPQGYTDSAGNLQYSLIKDVPGGNSPTNAAYQANAYIDSGRKQIVIAFRGTVVSSAQEMQTFKSLVAADSSFGSTVPNLILISLITAASKFVAAVHSEYKAATITLTGHSLGGGVAQLIGEESGLSTVAFNAPGGEQLFNPLSSELKYAANLGSDGLNVNYRMFADQISLFGTPFETTVTLQDPQGIPDISTPTNAARNVLANYPTILDLHYIATVIGQLANDAPQVLSVGQPNDAAALESFIQPSNSIVPNKGQELDNIFVAVTGSIGVLIDPDPGADFVLTAGSGSPSFAWIDLPAISGVSSYKIQYDTNGTWSAGQVIPPATEIDFGQGVSGVEFQPLNANGIGVTVNDSFLIGASFASTGTVNATLVQSNSTANVAVWTGQGDGTIWTDPQNWSNDLVPTAVDDVYIGAAAGNVVVPSGTYSVNSLASAAKIEISSGATLNLYNSSAIGDGASLTIDNGGALQVAPQGSSTSPDSLGVLGMSFDLSNGACDLKGASLSLINAEVAAGYSNGTWSGTGVLSSPAAVDSNHLTALGVIKNDQSGTAIYSSTNLFDGITPGVSDILIKYTYYGDANLDGKVDGSDYTRIDSGFLSGATGWYNGDFNYDGVVNGSDYTLIDNAFNRQGASLATLITSEKNDSTTARSSLVPPQINSASAEEQNLDNSEDSRRRANAFRNINPLLT